MASPTDIAFPSPRPLPWEDGWGPWAATPMSTMMRPRAGPSDPPVHSTHQYGPAHLVYRVGSLAGPGTVADRAAVIRGLVPEHLRGGWDILCSGRCRGPREL
eukprot:15475512-Alexandrium_andersonii.AAC.1